MARPPRLDYPGARHHVMNRVARKEPFFVDEAICVMFLTTLADIPRRFGARVHGYALMPNHFHLMLEVPRGNLSTVMQFVGGRFTQAYNRRKRHDGPVFRGRFRNALVNDDAYWMHLLAYLHLNPVAAGLATTPDQCLWTSHNAYLEPRHRPDWLTCDELLAMFGSMAELRRYIDDVHRKRRGAPESFEPEAFWSEPFTTVADLPPEPRTRTMMDALRELADVMEIDVPQVRELKRGRAPNRPAWLAAWWLPLATGESQASVGKVLGVSRGRVSQLQQKALELAREDRGFLEQMQRLELALLE